MRFSLILYNLLLHGVYILFIKIDYVSNNETLYSDWARNPCPNTSVWTIGPDFRPNLSVSELAEHFKICPDRRKALGSYPGSLCRSVWNHMKRQARPHCHALDKQNGAKSALIILMPVWTMLTGWAPDYCPNSVQIATKPLQNTSYDNTVHALMIHSFVCTYTDSRLHERR